MLGMEVSLRAVRARELAIRILLRNLILSSGSGCWGRWSTRRAGEDAPPTLGPHNVSGLVVVLKDGLRQQRALAVRRCKSGLLHHTAGRHRTKNWRDAPARRRRRGNGLGVRRRHRSLREHRGRCRVGLVRLRVGIVRHHLVRSPSRILVRRWRVASHGRRSRSVWSSWRARRMIVKRLHVGILRLKRGQCLGLERRRALLLKMLGREAGGRGVGGV
jgi:hypothetical protein